MDPMGSPATLGRRITVVAIALLLAGCGTGAVGAGNDAVESLPSAEAPPGDADALGADPQLQAAGAQAARAMLAADPDDAWATIDAVAAGLDHLWSARAGAYVSPGGLVSSRVNAELLRIHVAAAQADRDGASRHDERIDALVRYLTGPAFLTDRTGVEFGDSRHNVVHVPGWRESSASPVNQHPSIDAAVARALRSAWLARDRVGLPPATRAAITRTVVAVASSPAFRAPTRLLNQINWNADLYAAAATISGDPTPLRRDYRAQLSWFARHVHDPVTRRGLPNLTAGYSFVYHPEGTAEDLVNRSDTAEYANVVLGSLRYHRQAIEAGMRPLPEDERRALAAWAQRTRDADWTASGYLNWETGKGSTRLHLRQYWALALDGITGAIRGAPDVTAIPTADATRLLSRAATLFRGWVAREQSAFLPATAFGYPTSFASVRDNRITASVRIASTLAEWAAACDCEGELPDAPPADEHVRVSFDPRFQRLAVNGPRYATTLSPTARPTGGGVEPGWILDAAGRPLGPLGGGGDGSLGLQLRSPGRPPLDTQPGSTRAAGLTFRRDPHDERRFHATVAADGAAVEVSHRFTGDAIVTDYELRPGGEGWVSLRLPSRGRDGTVECRIAPPGSTPGFIPGCPAGNVYVVRSGGALLRVELTGIPTDARVDVGRPAARGTLSDPGQQITVGFPVREPLAIRRTLTPVDG